MQWEAYTLGRAPPTAEPGAELTVAQEQAIAANVELARHAGSRYLVQRWGDGTYCEKTGKKREIEIQVRTPHAGQLTGWFTSYLWGCSCVVLW